MIAPQIHKKSDHITLANSALEQQYIRYTKMKFSYMFVLIAIILVISSGQIEAKKTKKNKSKNLIETTTKVPLSAKGATTNDKVGPSDTTGTIVAGNEPSSGKGKGKGGLSGMSAEEIRAKVGHRIL